MYTTIVLSIFAILLGLLESYKYVWQATKIRRNRNSKGISRKFLAISVFTRLGLLLFLISTRQPTMIIVYIIGLYTTSVCLWEAYINYPKRYDNIFHYILAGFDRLPKYHVKNPFKGKKVIVADLDGTLTPSRSEVSDEMVQSIKKLLKYYKFVILGGGTLELFQKQLLDRLEPILSTEELNNLWILPCSGTKAYQVEDTKLGSSEELLKKEYPNKGYKELYKDELTQEEKYKIINTIIEFRKRFKLPAIYGNSYDDRGTQITLPILGLDAPLEEKKLYDPARAKRLKFAKWIRRQLKNYSVVVGGTTSIDITKKGLNKGYGIKRLVGLLHYNYKYYIFFGDSLQKGGNDYAVKAYIDTVEVKSDKETLKYFKKELKRKEK